MENSLNKDDIYVNQKDLYALTDEEILEKPYASRTVEERLRCCEIALAKLCQYNEENSPAIRAAWRYVSIG